MWPTTPAAPINDAVPNRPFRRNPPMFTFHPPADFHPHSIFISLYLHPNPTANPLPPLRLHTTPPPPNPTTSPPTPHHHPTITPPHHHPTITPSSPNLHLTLLPPHHHSTPSPSHHHSIVTSPSFCHQQAPSTSLPASPDPFLNAPRPILPCQLPSTTSPAPSHPSREAFLRLSLLLLSSLFAFAVPNFGLVAGFLGCEGGGIRTLA